jgi:tRNA dimethylallyltransferase
MHVIPIITGPTASGKSDLVLALAESLTGEIISADSVQIYKRFDIGTAKPSQFDLQKRKHHFINIVNFDEPYSVAKYQSEAVVLIKDMLLRGITPIVSGGTGLYIRSICGHDKYSNVPPCADFRSYCQREAELKGNYFLHSMLIKKNPEAARRLHPNDQRRIIRALEIAEFSALVAENDVDESELSPGVDYRLFGVAWERETLYQRINHRVDVMLEEGLVNEVERLRQDGVPIDCIPMMSLGYRQINQYLDGLIDFELMVKLIKQETRRYAKRQLTWHRNQFKIIWLNSNNALKENVKIILNNLKES